MIRVRISPRNAVDCHAVIKVPLSASAVWGQLRDFQTFARSDFFHAEIDVDGRIPRAAAALRIRHRFFLFRVERVGRICRWVEGAGYAFSDLSKLDPQRGFPHTFSYRIEPAGPDACQVHIHIRGRWTATLLPRWMTWLWLSWILHHLTRQVENHLLVYRIWLAQRKRRLQPLASNLA